jgi:hypothetical protein
MVGEQLTAVLRFMGWDSNDTQSRFYFECDAKRCAEVCVTPCVDFDSALEVLKEDGWEYRKVGKEWQHFCPEHGEDLEWMQ